MKNKTFVSGALLQRTSGPVPLWDEHEKICLGNVHRNDLVLLVSCAYKRKDVRRHVWRSCWQIYVVVCGPQGHGRGYVHDTFPHLWCRIDNEKGR